MAERDPRFVAAVLERWRPIALVLAGVVAANVLLHVLVIRRSVEVSGGREAILREERTRVAAVRAEVVGLERTASKLACVESDVEIVFDDLLSSKLERMTAIQRELRDMARERGLDPERIQYDAEPVRDTSLVKFGISFPLAGSYDTLQSFIEDVESSENFLIVENVDLQGAETGGALELQIRLVTYFQASDVEALAGAFPTLRRPA